MLCLAFANFSRSRLSSRVTFNLVARSFTRDLATRLGTWILKKQQKCTVTCQFLANSDEKSTEPTKFFLTEYSLGCSGYVTFNRIHCFRVFLHFSLFHDLHCLLGRQQCAVKNVEYHALCLRVSFTVVSCVVVYKECVIRWTSGRRWCLVEGVVTLLLWIQFVTVRDSGDRGES